MRAKLMKAALHHCGKGGLGGSSHYAFDPLDVVEGIGITASKLGHDVLAFGIHELLGLDGPTGDAWKPCLRTDVCWVAAAQRTGPCIVAMGGI